ncbi:hypothetical protein AGMMS49990_10310 [Endomicrobiia bacterium]|nr:hypothetical protein AGMMS49990_10310 [Endomicrobiia bacterium]
MSVKVVDIDIGYARRSINKEWGICTRWEEGIIKGRCRSRSSSDRCYRCDIKTSKTAKAAKQEEKKTTITVGSS